jgi:hypothetical protein
MSTYENERPEPTGPILEQILDAPIDQSGNRIMEVKPVTTRPEQLALSGLERVKPPRREERPEEEIG